MEERFRSLALLLTILALVHWLANQPAKVETVETKYCPISEKHAAKDRFGQWQVFWADKFGPCFLMDRYEEA